jgi:UPF0042 nucleotide-binding protein
MRIVFITGISGSGKTTALKTLEDIGFYTVDNIPIDMIYDFISLARKANIKDVALSLFFKDEKTAQKFSEIISQLKEEVKDGRVILMFLEASDDAIIRRYKETRRKHPFGDEIKSIDMAIKKEREILKLIFDISDIKLDTTQMNIHQLREKIRELFGDEKGMELTFQIYSFGFRYGIPQESDLVFDVRFIRNPNFDPQLKKFDGTHPEVQKYIFEDENARKYLEMIKEIIRFLTERFKKEGKFIATISIGCTGGRHRSVAFAEKIKEFIENEIKAKVILIHRDKEKESVI